MMRRAIVSMKAIPRSAIFLAAIWATIFAVPQLRERARVQISGSALMRFAVFPRPRLPDDFWAQAALQHPRDLDIWMEAAEEYPIDEKDNCACGIDGLEVKPAVESAAFPGKLNARYEKETARRYDILLARFPEREYSPLLIARRLRFTLAWFSSNRIGGELSDWKWKYGSKIPARETGEQPSNFTTAELQAAMALCRRGQKIDPQNAFFDYTLFQFLLAARRDDEAWRVLKSAAHKTAWSEYSPRLWQSEIRAHETAFGRALLWQESIGVMKFYQSGFNFDSEATRIVGWESIKARRRGDDAKALQLMGDLAEFGGLLRRNGARWDDAYIGAAIEQRAWDAASHDWRSGVLESKRFPKSMRNWFFQNYARKHGRPDLAQAAARSRREIAAMRTVQKAAYFRGLTAKELVALALWWRAGVFLVLFICSVALCLTAVEILARHWPRLKNSLQLETPNKALSRREIINGVLACGGFDLLGRAAFAAIIGAAWFFGFYLLSFPIAEFHQVFTDLMDEFSLGIRSPNPYSDFSPDTWANWIYEAYADPTLDWALRYHVPLAPLLLGVLYAATRAVAWQRKRNSEIPNAALPAFIKSLFNARWLHAGFTCAHLGFDMTRIVQYLDERLLFLGIGLAWLRRPHRRATWRYGFQLWRASLWGFLVLASTLYLLTLVVSLPLQNRAQAKLDAILQVGEIKALQFK